jgi:hypothetical protein
MSSSFPGSFRCPLDFDLFCYGLNYSMYTCNPSQNGICLVNGEAICRIGYGGLDCHALSCHKNCMTRQCTGETEYDCKILILILILKIYYKNY